MRGPARAPGAPVMRMPPLRVIARSAAVGKMNLTWSSASWSAASDQPSPVSPSLGGNRSSAGPGRKWLDKTSSSVGHARGDKTRQCAGEAQEIM